MEKPPAPALTEIVKCLISTIAFFGLCVFVIQNWSTLPSILLYVKSFEAFGVKLGMNEQQITRLPITSKAGERIYLPEDAKSAFSRGTWILPALAGSTILWVDDNPSNNNDEVEFLNVFQISVKVARDNDAAMHLLREHADRGRPFDLVISDVHRDNEKSPGKLDACPASYVNGESASEYNNNPDPGFHLAERIFQMAKKEGKEYYAPIIYYTSAGEKMNSACSRLVTKYPKNLIDVVFQVLTERRWKSLERFKLPWAQEPSKA